MNNIIVSLTSWSGRINTVADVIDSILCNTVKPDLIVLTLSTVEFPDSESSLPERLNKIISNGDVKVKWVSENERQFKKIIYTINDYPDDIIISIDDDVIYRNDFIEMLLRKFNKYNGKFPVTTWVNSKFTESIYGKNIYSHRGGGTIFKAEHFGKYLNELYYGFVKDIVIDNKIRVFDDPFYSYCAMLNNTPYRGCDLPDNSYIGKDMNFDNSVSSNNAHVLTEWHDKLLSEIKRKYNKTYKKGVGFYSDSVSFIVPNRGGENVDYVIKHINKTYSDIRHEVILVEQDDSKIFKKGQILNVAVSFSKYEYICFIDNDIFTLNKINIPYTYKKLGGPFCAFDTVSQVKLTGDSFKVTKVEKRPYGFGAYTIISRNDFIDKNGYSNLCFGWGAEDEIINISMNYKRLKQSIAHITHDRRINKNPKNRKFNAELLKMYKLGKIKHNLDGFRQTTFNVADIEEHDGYKKILVNNLDVVYDYKYKDLLKQSKMFSNGSTDEKIIISLTSWTKRINNIPTVLDSIFKQTLLPDKIVINLSSSEFKEKENSLPDTVKEYIEKHKTVEINWIDGPNTKQWKKFIPTMKKYPNDVIICIDDDKIYLDNLIETLYDKHLEYPNNPIQGGNCMYAGYRCHSGPCSLVMNKFFYNIDEFLNDDLYKMYSSDLFFTYVANYNGFKYINCGFDFEVKSKKFNEIEALHSVKGITNRLATMWHYMKSHYPMKNNQINNNIIEKKNKTSRDVNATSRHEITNKTYVNQVNKQHIHYRPTRKKRKVPFTFY